jgi:two-component system, sensor histidine kinase
MSERPDAARANAIKRERVHLFFRTRYVPYLGRLRLLQLLSVGGALYTGLLVWLVCDLHPLQVVAYGSAVMIAEALITKLNEAFERACPADESLWKWGWAKTALCGLVAVAWSLGPFLLHVPSAPSSVLIPVTALIYFVTASSGMVGSGYPPCMVVFALSAILPSALWLTTVGPPSGIEHTAAICLLALLPCMAATGSIGLSKSKIAINNRLDIAELLDIKARQAQQIEELFSERTRFFSAASHDLRQPLNAMGMYFELLSRSPYHGDRGEILDRLRDCAGSLMRQFDAIMEVAATDADIRNVNETNLAEATGLSVVHLNRTVQNLRRGKLIERKGQHVRLLRRKELAEIADFMPGYLHLCDRDWRGGASNVAS